MKLNKPPGEDEDEAFMETLEDKAKTQDLLFVAYEKGTEPNLAQLAYKLSLLNFF